VGEIARVVLTAAALPYEFRQTANIGDRLQVARRLFTAKSPVQV
jgi:hypothetical protein